MPKKWRPKKNIPEDFTVNHSANVVKPLQRHQKKTLPRDITINLSANADKPLTRLKKFSTTTPAPEPVDNEIDVEDVGKNNEEENPLNTEGSWEDIDYDNMDVTTKSLSCEHLQRECDTQIPGLEYPEIVWFLVSRYIRPEDVGRFACINRTTHAITNMEQFWRKLYKRYSWHSYSLRLPESLRLEINNKTYGIRQRVIRALYHTYPVFQAYVSAAACQESKPHDLIKRRCIYVWYEKVTKYWSIYFKFKRNRPIARSEAEADVIVKLGQVDANSEEDCKVLQVSCKDIFDISPIMGLTLSRVSVSLSQGFQHHQLRLGFVSGTHVSKHLLPECIVVIDSVVNMSVYDWWHPRYPYYENGISLKHDEDSEPMLKRDFFNYDVDL